MRKCAAQTVRLGFSIAEVRVSYSCLVYKQLSLILRQYYKEFSRRLCATFLGICNDPIGSFFGSKSIKDDLDELYTRSSFRSNQIRRRFDIATVLYEDWVASKCLHAYVKGF